MATEASQPLKISLPCSAALLNALYAEWVAGGIANGYAGTPAQYTFVKVNAAGNLDLIASQADVAIGVIQNAPFIVANGASQVAGTAGEVVVLGVTKVRVAAGAGLILNASTPGNGIVVSTTAGSVGCAVTSGGYVSSAGGKNVVGQALTAANALDLVKAVVNCTLPLPIGA